MERTRYLAEIKDIFRIHSVCAILGARQVGKTTLARQFIKTEHRGEVEFFDLENPLDLARLENPMTALSPIADKLVVIDEIQQRPDLFPIIRVLVDQQKRKFLILGSASRDLIRQSSETLAGRIGYMELPPFSIPEVHESEKLWIRGGFPLAYLASREEDSYVWRQNYIKTFLERDIPALGFSVPAQQMRRFWLMLVHYHGQIFNGSEIARSLGISQHVVRKYLDILAGTFMMRIMNPWFENIQKRQVKSPKIYFRDSGILNALIGITDKKQMDVYPKLGAFWEGFALEEIIRVIGATSEECFFWATHADAELDLLIFKDGKRLGFEFKYGDAPKITKSMRIAQQDLKLDHLIVVYPGSVHFAMDTNISAYGLSKLEYKTLAGLWNK